MVMWLVTGGKTHREYKSSLDHFKAAATSSPCETFLHRSTRKAKKTITKNEKAEQNKTITIRKKVMVTTSKWNTRTRKVYGCLSQRLLTFPWPFPDIFLTNVKFPFMTNWINNFTNFSPDNGLNPPLMFSASHVPCTWIDSSSTQHAKRIDFLRNPTSANINHVREM